MSTPSLEVKIWKALEAKILSLNIQDKVIWPSDITEKPFDGNGVLTYIEIRHLPNLSNRLLIGSNDPHEYLGILQLSYFFPVTLSLSIDNMLQEAGAIAALFQVDERLPFQDIEVKVTKKPDVRQGFRNGPYWQYPVSINWRCFAS